MLVVSINSGSDLGVVRLDQRSEPTRLIEAPDIQTNAEVSPDGRWLAYESGESGQREIIVRPFPNVDAGRWQISTNGGQRPVWARSGRELFYDGVRDVGMTAVSITGGATFTRQSDRAVPDDRRLQQVARRRTHVRCFSGRSEVPDDQGCDRGQQALHRKSGGGAQIGSKSCASAQRPIVGCACSTTSLGMFAMPRGCWREARPSPPLPCSRSRSASAPPAPSWLHRQH